MKTSRENNRKYIYLGILSFILALYIFYLPFKSISTEVMMLFTSKSSQLITGYLNSYPTFIRPIVAIGLMVLQATIVPFKYEIMIFANIKVFGFMMGLILSILGRIIGAYICFDLGRVLIGKKLDKLTQKLGWHEGLAYARNTYGTHLLVRLIPLNFDLISYLMGILKLDFKKYMIISAGWIILTTTFYAVNDGYFSSYWELISLVIRLVLMIVILLKIIQKKNFGQA